MPKKKAAKAKPKPEPVITPSSGGTKLLDILVGTPKRSKIVLVVAIVLVVVTLFSVIF